MNRQMSQFLVIMLVAIVAIMVNAHPDGGSNLAVAVIATILLAGSAVLMETQKR